MIVVIVDNPEQDNPERKGTDFEIRIMFRGATVEEGDKIGEAIRRLAFDIRPDVTPTCFAVDPEKVVAA